MPAKTAKPTRFIEKTRELELFPIRGYQKGRAFGRAVGVLQLEWVKCGKRGCCGAEPRHGPYWYLYLSYHGRAKKWYIGRRIDRKRSTILEQVRAWIGPAAYPVEPSPATRKPVRRGGLIER